MYNWMIFKFLSGVDELSLPFLGINRYLYSSLNWKFLFFCCCCVFHFLLVSLFVCTLLIGTPSSSSSTSRKFIFLKPHADGTNNNGIS